MLNKNIEVESPMRHIEQLAAGDEKQSLKRFVVTVAAIATVALLCWAAPVQAAPITYTITTTATGTLGASPFTSAVVTLTLTGDTSAVTFGPGPNLNNFLINPGAATVGIAGLGAATLTGSIEIISTFDTPFPEGSLVVIGQLDNPAGTSTTGILWTIGPTFFGYNLQTALGPVSGAGSVANQGPVDGFFPTTAGNLQFAAGQGGGVGSSTFTASTVPEPSTLRSSEPVSSLSPVATSGAGVSHAQPVEPTNFTIIRP